VSTAAEDVLSPAKTKPLPRQISKAATKNREATSNQFRLNQQMTASKLRKTTPRKIHPVYSFMLVDVRVGLRFLVASNSKISSDNSVEGNGTL
jgi:hypothetical protein